MWLQGQCTNTVANSSRVSLEMKEILHITMTARWSVTGTKCDTSTDTSILL